MLKQGHKRPLVPLKKTVGQATARKGGLPRSLFCGGQAATELAIFGAILIFLIGTIVRVVASNSYYQGHNFEAMRMAMLSSWRAASDKENAGQKPQNTAHNTASVLFIEDRLSPDAGKYGDLERNPYIAQGSGTLSYNLLYPLSNARDVKESLPVLDMHINGQHFPFSMSSYVRDRAIRPPALSDCQKLPANSCQAKQCFRNLREWGGGVLRAISLEAPNVAPITREGTTAAERKAQMKNNACTIFSGLAQAQIILLDSANPTECTSSSIGQINPELISPLKDSSQWAVFKGQYEESYFPQNTEGQNKKYLNAILEILKKVQHRYKLFYYKEVNANVSSFSMYAPVCFSHPCKGKELSLDVPLRGYTGNLTVDGLGASTNVNAVMQYDLSRNADYSTTTGVLSPAQFPFSSCPNCLRDRIVWQWAATAAVSPKFIGLNRDNNQYPSYDIDGRLKEVTIYRFRKDDNGIVFVDYEDPAGGDIDGSWDINSCGPKPGIQTNSQVYTFTKEGTYLQIKEGKLYNPETGQFVRSANKRNTIDLVQRTIQLSNNTGRFCSNVSSISPPQPCTGSGCANPNPVEVCVDEKTILSNCFTAENIAHTCYDTASNIMFVRSRLQDKRGRFWMTDTSGQLKVQ